MADITTAPKLPEKPTHADRIKFAQQVKKERCLMFEEQRDFGQRGTQALLSSLDN
jgi:hypothetical protein